MRLMIPVVAVVALALPSAARADEPAFLPPRLGSALEVPTSLQPPATLPVPAQPAAKQPAPKPPDPKLPAVKQPEPKGPPSPVERAFASPFARGAEAGGVAARSFNENFDGDFRGVFYRLSLVTGTAPVTRVIGFNQQVVGTHQRQVGTTPRVIGNTQTVVIDPLGNRTVTTTPVVVQDPVFVLDPVIATTPVTATEQVARVTQAQILAASRYAGVMITDNDSPRPTDRVYAGYNFYYDTGAALNPGLGGSNVQQQMAGFELTLFDGDASVGMRLPYVQQYGPVGLGSQTVGDLSVLFKYAFYNDRDTGDLISGGLVLTTPTGGGGGLLLADGSPLPHSTLFQPWGGFVKMFEAGYVQGITNLIVPTDARDPTVFGHSMAAGYFLYQAPDAPLLTGIVPKAEVHVRAPLNRRDPNGLVYMMDQVNVNGGAVFRFHRAALSASVGVPLVGPRPWAVEAVSFLNVSF
jgi:hypothetical protein